jgi:apolipoprotein N-acyltransferase
MTLTKLFAPGWLGDLLVLLSGASLSFAFAPYDIFVLAIIAPALLLASWLNVTPTKAFLRGFLFGLGFFASSIYWVYISIHTYGQASYLLSSTITLGFILILSLFPALNGYWLNKYFSQTNWAKILCAFPAMWVLLEWVRSWICTGFPWLFLGYSQTNTPLKGYAPLASVYAISLALVISSSLAIYFFLLFKKNRKNAYACLIFIAFVWMLGGILSYIPWTKPQGEPVQVSLVQGDIPQQVKWSLEQIQPTLDQYERLTLPHWTSKIIVWPEAAIPMTLQDAAPFIEKMSQLALKHNATLITGIPVLTPTTGFYNAVITIGEGKGAYLKRRLVPFGEYMPLPNWANKWLTSLNIPMSDFIPGPAKPMLLQANNITIAAYICFEIAFPEMVRSRNSDIGMLLTVSNDAWFGHSTAQAQHLETAKMRALEMRRPVLFVSNNGITAIITPFGKIQSSIPAFAEGVLTDQVQARTGMTPWQTLAMDPILLLLVFMLVIAVRFKRN